MSRAQPASPPPDPAVMMRRAPITALRVTATGYHTATDQRGKEHQR